MKSQLLKVILKLFLPETKLIKLKTRLMILHDELDKFRVISLMLKSGLMKPKVHSTNYEDVLYSLLPKLSVLVSNKLVFKTQQTYFFAQVVFE